ncbi:MAG TPA: DUF6134 family protein [Geminicoccaceae bacterium]|jgi:hypothetical protein|nr:DUF6134 family protein [Geminicoccaceae bacterium]
MARCACLLAVLLAFAVEARSLEVGALEAPASYRYRIHHQIFGDIGEHRMTVRREAGAIVVEHTAELAVEILGLTAFHRSTRLREVWRDGYLLAFDGLIEDDGEPFPVTARAEGDHLIIEGRAGRIEASAGTAPSEPSLERAIRRDWFFDMKTGRLLRATVTPAGREPVKVGDTVVDAARYEITGDLEQHVWFDRTGAWVQWRLWRQGAAITLVRE